MTVKGRQQQVPLKLRSCFPHGTRRMMLHGLDLRYRTTGLRVLMSKK
jgi:hypothetical protein